MIEIIGHTFLEDEIINGKITNKKGDVIVSHGVDHDSCENVILPTEPYNSFIKEHCKLVNNTWFLKE
jgi:hypothetical protein